jgi:Cdc6-like AAA superfamily ATPase
MSPEMLKIQELERKVRDLENATNPAFTASLLRQIGGIQLTATPGADGTGTTIVVRNSSNTGTEVVANEYTGVLALTINGVNYRIGYY